MMNSLKYRLILDFNKKIPKRFFLNLLFFLCKVTLTLNNHIILVHLLFNFQYLEN